MSVAVKYSSVYSQATGLSGAQVTQPRSRPPCRDMQSTGGHSQPCQATSASRRWSFWHALARPAAEPCRHAALNAAGLSPTEDQCSTALSDGSGHDVSICQQVWCVEGMPGMLGAGLQGCGCHCLARLHAGHGAQGVLYQAVSIARARQRQHQLAATAERLHAHACFSGAAHATGKGALRSSVASATGCSCAWLAHAGLVVAPREVYHLLGDWALMCSAGGGSCRLTLAVPHIQQG